MPMGIGLGIGVTRGGGVGWWPAGSELAFEFDNGRGFNSIDRTKTTPDSILTYTNPSAKMVYGSDGVLRYAPHNLLLQSQTFETAGWTVTSTISANDGVAPDGTLTADLLTPTANDQNANQLLTGLQQINGVTYTFSVWMRAETAHTATLRMFEGALAGGITKVDVNVTTEWQRFSLTTTWAVSGTSIRVLLYPKQFGTGNPNLGVYIWGAQLNLGSSALTYIPTTTAAKYSLPIDHNPTTFAPLGVLIEEQRINLLQWSQAADNAAWSKVALLTVNGNNAGAPDGTATFCNLTPNTTNTQHYISTAAFTPAASALCCSAYFKANGYRWVRFAHSTGIISFDTLTGTIGATSGITSSGVQSLGNGVYRAWFVYTASAVSTSIFISVNNADNTGTTSFAGDGTSGVFVWGAQAEQGAFPTSYIPTTNNPLGVTRLADQVSILTSAFAYNASEGTLVVEARVNALKSASNRIASFYGPSSRLADVYALTTPSIAYYKTSDASQVTIGSAVAAQAPFKVGIAYKLNDYQGVLGGTLGGADTSTGALPTDTSTLGVGNWNNDSASILSGHIKRLTYFPTRRTDADLQVLST